MTGLSILHKHYRLENMEVNSVRVEKASIIPYGFNFNDGIVMQVLKKKKIIVYERLRLPSEASQCE